jgi:hypothetical protein
MNRLGCFACLQRLSLLILFQCGLISTAFASDTGSSRSIAVRVELSSAAHKALQQSGESLTLRTEFADEIGPGGDYLGAYTYEVFKPERAMAFVVAVPIVRMISSERKDYEIKINAYSGNRGKKKVTYLDCSLVQDQESVLIERTNVITCDLHRPKLK